jgi:hypothetical protein
MNTAALQYSWNNVYNDYSERWAVGCDGGGN